MMQERYQTPIAIVQEYKKKQEFKYEGEERVKPGHLFFEFEFDTGILKVVERKVENTRVMHTPPIIRGQGLLGTPVEATTKRVKVEKRAGCYYFGALNFENAFKRLRKLMPGISFDLIP